MINCSRYLQFITIILSILILDYYDLYNFRLFIGSIYHLDADNVIHKRDQSDWKQFKVLAPETGSVINNIALQRSAALLCEQHYYVIEFGFG